MENRRHALAQQLVTNAPARERQRRTTREKALGETENSNAKEC